MARPRTALGTHGTIQVVGLVKDATGKLIDAPDGTRPSVWRARTRLRDADGVARLIEKRGATKAKAENALKAALVQRQTPTKSSGGFRTDMSMLDAGQVWVEQNEYAELSPKTRTQYANEFDRYIKGSTIQGLSLREVNNVATIERFLQGIADASGNAAAKAARRVLSNLLGMAVRHGVLQFSASRDVRQPKARADSISATRDRREHDTDRAFTRKERAHALKVADGHPDDAALDISDLMAFLAGTGVRLSEALECTFWVDVDFDAVDASDAATPTVHVRGTKTDKADRVLPMPPWLAERLKERSERIGTAGLVFASPRLKDKTKPRDRRNVLRHVRTRLDLADLPWASSHTFRRTVATWMDEAGAPLAEIANQLGHANVNVTATYLGRRQGSNRAASVL